MSQDPQVRSVCVFCASSDLVPQVYLDLAARTGELLAQRGVVLIYGGARCGMMGALADAALDAGGRVVGVMPEALVALEVAHTGLSEFILTRDMMERKAVMMHQSDAFLTLPGGVGTLDEFFEVITHFDLGYHEKPSVIFDHEGFYAPLLNWLVHAASNRFIRDLDRHFEVGRSLAECERLLRLS